MDEWLLRNIAPLLVIFLSMTVGILCEVTLASRRSPPKPVAVPGITDVRGKPAKKKVEPLRQALDKATSEMPFHVPPQVWLGLWSGLLLFYIVFTFPEARAWLDRVFRQVAVRPLPALRIMDLIAVIAATFASMRGLAVLFLSGGGGSAGTELRAASLILSGAGFGIGILTGVMLARYRARHPRGSEGIWPFWTLAPGQQRSIWYDVLIGALCYPPSMLIMGLCLYVNHTLVYLLGREQDEHPLLSELASSPSPWALFIFFVMATVGAAFFEETIFRGIFYNTFRRYFGAATAASLAAFIFAALHGIASQVLGLFMLGLILTWLYDRTGRLVAGMTLHFVNNMFAMIYTLFLSQHG